jgi:hypothetical protein
MPTWIQALIQECVNLLLGELTPATVKGAMVDLLAMLVAGLRALATGASGTWAPTEQAVVAQVVTDLESVITALGASSSP